MLSITWVRRGLAAAGGCVVLGAAAQPMAVVDKEAATLQLFAADGRWIATTPVLVGMAPGDRDGPDPRAQIAAGGLAPEHRITPAGRFRTEPGHNRKGERVIWFDYEAALAIHRLRPAPAAERRPERLASATPADNRITAGCIVVDGDFFDRVLLPVMGHGRGRLVVLAEDGGGL